MARHDDFQRTEAGDRDTWRAWLEQHHTTAEGTWLVSFKKATGRPAMVYGEAVEEALCFGWIDSLGRRLDNERTMLMFTPRKPTSRWSRPNKERVARLQAAGLMTPAGQELIDLAQASGTWTALDDVENLVVPEDLAAALGRRPGARGRWDAFPRSARRGMLEWLLDAKRPVTRENRLAEIADGAERGERAR